MSQGRRCRASGEEVQCMALALLVGFGTLLISLPSYGMATALIVHLVVPVLQPGRAGTGVWKDFVVMVMVSLAKALVHVIQIVLWATTTPFDMVVLNDLDRFHGRDRPGAATGPAGRLRQAGAAEQVDRPQALCLQARRRHAGN